MGNQNPKNITLKRAGPNPSLENILNNPIIVI